jgi:hypothetical protein
MVLLEWCQHQVMVVGLQELMYHPSAVVLLLCLAQVDAAHVSDGQDMEATREYVADLVTRQMGCEGFQLRPEQVGDGVGRALQCMTCHGQHMLS